MKFKILILFFAAFILKSEKAYCVLEFKNFSSQTPGGNEIYYDDDRYMKINFRTGEEMLGLTSFYFYRNHIIGKNVKDFNNINPTEYYFVINESTIKINEFNSLNDWKNYIIENNLKPKVWTRWYDDNWKFFERSFILSFLLLITCIFIMPLYILYYLMVIWPENKYTFRLKKKRIYQIAAICGFLLLRYLLDVFPQSF